MNELPHLERKLHTCQVILWLRRSFQHVKPHNAEGGDGDDGEAGADEQEITISKEALYQAYIAMCGTTDASPLFSRPVVGKMVKRAFPTIQTRRRGPRTNVKQHWIGLHQLTNDELLLSDDSSGPSHEDLAQPPAQAHSSPSPSPSSSLSSSSNSTMPEQSGVPVMNSTSTSRADRAAVAAAQAQAQPAVHSSYNHHQGQLHNNPSSQPPQPSLAGHNRMDPPQLYALPCHGPDLGYYHQMRWQLEQQRHREEERRSFNYDWQQQHQPQQYSPPHSHLKVEPQYLEHPMPPDYELSPQPVASEIVPDYLLPLRQTTASPNRHHHHQQQPLQRLPPQPHPQPHPQPNHRQHLHHHSPAHNLHHSPDASVSERRPRPPREGPGQSPAGERRRTDERCTDHNVWAGRMIAATSSEEPQKRRGHLPATTPPPGRQRSSSHTPRKCNSIN